MRIDDLLTGANTDIVLYDFAEKAKYQLLIGEVRKKYGVPDLITEEEAAFLESKGK